MGAENRRESVKGNELCEETAAKRRKRYASLLITNVAAFNAMLGSSVTSTGAFPYLLQLDPSADKEFFGWTAAVSSLPQLLLGPLIGYLIYKLRKCTLFFTTTILCQTLGFLLYACLGALPGQRKYIVIAARLIAGIATLTVCQTYTVMATSLTERTMAVSTTLLCMTAGVIAGPALQSALIPLGEHGLLVGLSGMELNMYTTAALITASAGFITLLLFTLPVFNEHDIAKRAVIGQRRRSSLKKAVKTDKENLLGILLCIGVLTQTIHCSALEESLATPLVMDQIAMSQSDSVKWVGIIFALGGLSSSLCFPVMGYLSGKYKQNKLNLKYIPNMSLSRPLAAPLRLNDFQIMVYLGLLPQVLSGLWLLPYGGSPPIIQQVNSTSFLNQSDPRSELGCPAEQTWCETTPALQSFQLVTGFMLFSLSFAFTNAASWSLLSKLSKPGQQGVWFGVVAAATAIVRIVCPIYYSFMYSRFGTWAVFCTSLFLSVAVFATVLLFRQRLQLNADHPVQEGRRSLESIRRMSMCAINGAFYDFDETE